MNKNTDYSDLNRFVSEPIGSIQPVTKREIGNFYVPISQEETDEHILESSKKAKTKKILHRIGIAVCLIFVLIAVLHFIL